MPIPVAERSKKVCGRSLAGTGGLNPAGVIDVFSCGSCALSNRGLCDEPITRPGETCRLWCVVVCDIETSRMRRPCPELGCCAIGGKGWGGGRRRDRKRKGRRCYEIKNFGLIKY